MGHTLKELPDNQVIRLDNISCPYCGKEYTNENKSKEHVIGKRFVPTGKLNACWNLILNACKTCNGDKADLENDISAITMQPDAVGNFAHDDASGASEAARKARNSYSRRTLKLVKDSHEQMKVDVSFGPGVKMSFGLIGPPQVDRERVYQLAHMQLIGFFYWITYQENAKHGNYWPGDFSPVMTANRADWGNSVLLAFADTVLDWEPRVRGITTDGFYKIMIRKSPQFSCWSWALEWNHSLRVIGFFGDLQTAHNILSDFPKLKGYAIPQGPDVTIRYREETPLPEDEDDKLFCLDDVND